MHIVQDLSSASFADISYSSPGLQPNPPPPAIYLRRSLHIVILVQDYSPIFQPLVISPV